MSLIVLQKCRNFVAKKSGHHVCDPRLSLQLPFLNAVRYAMDSRAYLIMCLTDKGITHVCRTRLRAHVSMTALNLNNLHI